MVELQRTSRAVCCAKWSPEGFLLLKENPMNLFVFQ
jgi:hypothetical protein